MKRFPYTPGEFAAVIFKVRRASESSEEVAVAYNERTHHFNFRDRIIIDGEPFYVGGSGFEHYRDVDLHFKTFTLIHQSWHDDNVRAEREYKGRQNFGRMLRGALGVAHQPILDLEPDLGAVYYLDDLLETGI